MICNYTELLAQWLSGYIDVPAGEIEAAIETPPDSSMGHFAYPCFKLAKALHKAPPAIAAELTVKMVDRPKWIERVQAVGAYINMFVDRASFAEAVITAILGMGGGYGGSDIGGSQVALIEYSSPNTAKHFHVGHLGSTIIGRALYNILGFLGYKTIGINYVGDWGTSFGKLITAYLKWGDRDEIERTGIDGLNKLYVRFHEEADKDGSLNDEARSWVVRMQEGDERGLSLWRWFCDMSMVEYERVYGRLNVQFDVIRGESYYRDRMGAVAEELARKGLLLESEGARIVDLEEYGMPPCLILRSDGGTLYHTRDIAAAIDRYETYHFKKCLIVTASEQILYFAQLKKVIELMGYPWHENIEHIPYGLFIFESGKLSTRKGHVIKMEDLLDEAIMKTLAIINEKNPDLVNKEEVAKQVGVGAVIFNKLYNGRIKDVVFSWEQMLNFEGETGPYVQYSHARACSVLDKANFSTNGFSIDRIDFNKLKDDEAFEVMRILYQFPEKVADAAQKYEPFIVSRHLVALAQAFNKFYHERTVLSDDGVVKNARLALVYSVKTVLCTGLSLLGIAAPEKM